MQSSDAKDSVSIFARAEKKICQLRVGGGSGNVYISHINVREHEENRTGVINKQRFNILFCQLN